MADDVITLRRSTVVRAGVVALVLAALGGGIAIGLSAGSSPAPRAAAIVRHPHKSTTTTTATPTTTTAAPVGPNGPIPPITTVTVPNVFGQSMAAAQATLTNAGLVGQAGSFDQGCANGASPGQIDNMAPAPGSKVPQGSIVTVYPCENP